MEKKITLVIIFFILQNIIATTSKCGENCLTCTSTGCTKCYRSFVYSNNRCIPNSIAIDDKCLIYSKEGDCEMCMKGYGYDGSRCEFLLLPSETREKCIIGNIVGGIQPLCFGCENSFPNETFGFCGDKSKECEIGTRNFDGSQKCIKCGEENHVATPEGNCLKEVEIIKTVEESCKKQISFDCKSGNDIKKVFEGCMIVKWIKSENQIVDVQCDQCDFWEGWFDAEGDGRCYKN